MYQTVPALYFGLYLCVIIEAVRFKDGGTGVSVNTSVLHQVTDTCNIIR